MKIIGWSLAVLITIPVSFLVLFVIVQTLASERVEVVALHTLDAKGETITTRIWVADHDGYQYLRVGSDGSGWFRRLQTSKTVKLTRHDTTRTYETLIRPDKSDLINNLMQEKYTWGDSFFATVLGGRKGSIPIELHEI